MFISPVLMYVDNKQDVRMRLKHPIEASLKRDSPFVTRHETIRKEFCVIFRRMDLLYDASVHRFRNKRSYET